MKAGIVGLPNVGKSTLFNAITRTRKAEAANYPFCTIEPNVGVVTVPDARLEPLAKIAKTTASSRRQLNSWTSPAWSRARATAKASATNSSATSAKWTPSCRSSAASRTPDIHHVTGTIDPVRDIEIINTELVLADLDNIKKRREKRRQGRASAATRPPKPRSPCSRN